MRRLLSVAVLLALAMPALADDAKDECKGEYFEINGKRLCLVAAEPEDWYRTADQKQKDPAPGSLIELPPKPPHKRPVLRLSFSLPAGALPTFNAFDGAALHLDQQNFGSREGLHEGELVTDRTLMNDAVLGRSLRDRSWGVRLRIATSGSSRWSLDLSWTKVKPYTIVQVFSSEFVTTGRYYEDCPAWEGTGPCTDFGGMFNEDTQYNEHRVQLHVFRAGLGFDVLHSSRFLSLEPGLGVEFSTAKNSMTVLQKRFTGSYENEEVVQDREATDWLAPNQAPYASLSVDVYPLGKDRFISLGVTTRYLPFTSDYWAFRDATLAGPYEVPVRSRRWTTSLNATLAF